MIFIFLLSRSPKSPLRPSQLHIQWIPEFLPGGKADVPWGWHSSTFSAEVRNEWRYTSTRLIWLDADKDSFTFFHPLSQNLVEELRPYRKPQLCALCTSSTQLQYSVWTVCCSCVHKQYTVWTVCCSCVHKQYTVWTVLSGKVKEDRGKVNPRKSHEGPEGE